MLKNVKLKKILKGTVFKAFSCLNKALPKDEDFILLHMGNKHLGFNLKPLYDYLIIHKYNEKYNIICSVESKAFFGETEKNVIFVTHFEAIKWFLKCKHVFYTAGQLPIKPSPQQIVIHMNHGITDYKTVGALTKINNGDEFFFSHMIASSPLYVPILAKEYRCGIKNIKICSEPMVDRLLAPVNKYNFSGYQKVLLWVPTFRQSDYLGYDDSAQEELIPLFSDDNYQMLNCMLKRKNCLLLVKIHSSQNMTKHKQRMFSNLKVYSHEEFENTGMNLYDLMAQVDGLIGDYSSASLQFLLTNKPLAYVIPDFEEYKEKRGFVFEDPLQYMPGHIITNIDEFEMFLKDFCAGLDNYKDQRECIKNVIHTYQDGKSCERLLLMSEIERGEKCIL